MHLASAVCLAMTEIPRRPSTRWEDAAVLLIFAALGTYVLGGMFVLCQTVRVSRPYRPGLLTWVPFALLGIIWLAPIGALWLAAVGVVELLS